MLCIYVFQKWIIADTLNIHQVFISEFTGHNLT